MSEITVLSLKTGKLEASSVHTATDGTSDTAVFSESAVNTKVAAAVTTAAGYTDSSISTVNATIAALALAGMNLHVVQARATGNVNLSTGLVAGQTIDGVTVVAGLDYFLGAQTTTSQNGIYTGVASGTASRSPRFDTGSNEIVGSAIIVADTTASTYKAGSLFAVTNTGTFTVGTTVLAVSANLNPLVGYTAETGSLGGGTTTLPNSAVVTAAVAAALAAAEAYTDSAVAAASSPRIYTAVSGFYLGGSGIGTTETIYDPATSTGTRTILANTLAVGDQIILEIGGVQDVGQQGDSASNFNLYHYFGATNAFGYALSFPQDTNNPGSCMWRERLTAVVETIGSSGVLQAHSVLTYQKADGSGNIGVVTDLKRLLNIAIDTTADMLIDVTGEFSVSQPNSRFSVDKGQYTIDVVKHP